DHEVVVGRVLVQAGATASQGRVGQAGYALGQEGACLLDVLGRGVAIRVRVDDLAAQVVGDLQPALPLERVAVPALDVRLDRVDRHRPGRVQLRVGRLEESHELARDQDVAADRRDQPDEPDPGRDHDTGA